MRGLKLAALLLVAGLISSASGAALWGAGGRAQFLPAGEAFRVVSAEKRGDGIHVIWAIAPGYYLYRDRLSIKSKDGRGVRLRLPAAQTLADPAFGNPAIYRLQLDARVNALPKAPEPLQLVLHYQGCADAGLCYPPQQTDISITTPTP